MDDRELLEMAAKAAGLRVICHASYPQGGVYVDDMEDDWNPITDDGDALRLAVKCGIDITPFVGSKVSRSRMLSQMASEIVEAHGIDPYAATRRAIVRAAAEIGKGMK